MWGSSAPGSPSTGSPAGRAPPHGDGSMYSQAQHVRPAAPSSSRRASVPARSPKIISGKAGDKCLFPHHKVDEQPNKKPQKGYYSHKRRGSDDKNAVAIVKFCTTIGFASRKTRMRWFLKEANSSGKPGAKSLGTGSKSTIHSVDAASSMYPGKERTIAWNNTSPNLNISEVPTP